jgi:hypothetical protein
MLKVAISQPTYLPWLGYFNQIANSDIFVFLDNVQVERRSWQTRNRIKDAQDNEIWLSVPVKAARHDLIQNTEILYSNTNWINKHIKSIQQNLAKAPFVDDVLSLMDAMANIQFVSLAELNIYLIKSVCSKLAIDKPFVRSSSLSATGKKADFLLDILTELNATNYLSNAGSRDYLELARDKFLQTGIKVEYQKWPHPIYTQKGNKFFPYLSWVDAVSYLGFENVATLVKT